MKEACILATIVLFVGLLVVGIPAAYAAGPELTIDPKEIVPGKNVGITIKNPSAGDMILEWTQVTRPDSNKDQHPGGTIPAGSSITFDYPSGFPAGANTNKIGEYKVEVRWKTENGNGKSVTDTFEVAKKTDFKLISPAEQMIEPAEGAIFKFKLKNNVFEKYPVEISAICKEIREFGVNVDVGEAYAWDAIIDGHTLSMKKDEGTTFFVWLEPGEEKEIEMVVNSSSSHEPGDFVKIEVSDPDGTITTSILTTTAIIPEFTTIAIPVATILGLVFLFSRRKRKE